jgi:CBS domain-containing protein
VITCAADTRLPTVARMMAGHRIHAVVVRGDDGELPPGIVSDLDLVGSATDDAFETRTAKELAATDALSVKATEPLVRVVGLMREYATSHLVVTDPQSKHPIGVVSSIDVIEALSELDGPGEPGEQG